MTRRESTIVRKQPKIVHCDSDHGTQARLHALLVGDDQMAQVCRDLPESACRAQPQNYRVNIASLILTRVGEGLADPKLVLAWLLDAIGTPTWALGLLLAATLAVLANTVAAFIALAMPSVLEESALLPALLFVLMIAHQGVRLGRSVHIVDMADRDNRATYTALSNSVVGLILLAAGVFGVIAQWLGIGAVLAIFTLMGAMAIVAAAGLDDVQVA